MSDNFISNDNLSSNSVNVDKLIRLVNKIEALEIQKKEIVKEIKDVYLEAKSQGYDIAALKKVIALKMSNTQVKEKIEQESSMFELYRSALNI
ncbi:MAG: DUF2312 domain-containing protein [Rickettsiales bacterium]